MSRRGDIRRTTVELDVDLDRRVRARLAEERRSLRELVSDALRLYLGGPPQPSADAEPAPFKSDNSLPTDVRQLIDEIRRLLPEVTAVVADHAELMDALDSIATEIGHGRGAMAALEQAKSDLARDR